MSNFGGAGGAEYEFITQDHATSIQMKLARRACLERNISRCPDFIRLDMSSAHRNTRLARLAGKSGRRRASPCGDTGDGTNEQLKSIAFAITLVAQTHSAAGPRPLAEARGSRARNTGFYITFHVCAGIIKRESPRSSGRARGKKPRPPARTRLSPLHARQDGFLERRERESCLDTYGHSIK